MSRSYTFVPTEFFAVVSELLNQVARDPAAMIKVDDVTTIYFAGDPAVKVEASGTHAGAQLACLRVLGEGVLQLDTQGYQRSVEHATFWVRKLLNWSRFKVYDDVTGEDCSNLAHGQPEALFTR